MPMNGGGTSSRVPGAAAAPNTTIKSADYNAEMDDVYNILNTARPVAYGGTGATDAAGARANLGTAGLADANTFTKIQKWAKGADVASAATLTLGDDGNYFDITGTTAITSIASKGVGTVVKLHFDAALTLTHHATDLVLSGGADITTAAGDEAEFIEYAAGDWRCTNYQRATARGFLQRVWATPYTTKSNLSTVIPADDTIPQQSEGWELLTATITPISASSKLVVRAWVVGDVDSASVWTMALFRDSDADAIAATSGREALMAASLEYQMDSPGTTSTTFKVRVGPATGGTLYINGVSSTRIYGGVSACTLSVEEIL